MEISLAIAVCVGLVALRGHRNPIGWGALAGLLAFGTHTVAALVGAHLAVTQDGETLGLASALFGPIAGIAIGVTFGIGLLRHPRPAPLPDALVVRGGASVEAPLRGSPSTGGPWTLTLLGDRLSFEREGCPGEHLVLRSLEKLEVDGDAVVLGWHDEFGAVRGERLVPETHVANAVVRTIRKRMPV